MTRAFLISRRRLLTAAASALGLQALPAPVRRALADENPPSDRGIGGTGITGEPGEGAIGFIGSIQRFGSIFVNGSRIAYPADARVVVDGRVGGPGDLVIGQVVKTVARVSGDHLETDHVEVLSEVVGPVAARDGPVMVVLGQRIDCGTTGTDAFAIGERIAVSGIRRLDGTIVARLIQPAAWRMDQVVGPARFEGWTLRIGDLNLFGPDQRYEGRRIVVRGSMGRRGFMVSSVALDRPPEGLGVTQLSIEGFAARHGNEMQLGSGFVFSDHAMEMTTHHEGGPSYFDVSLSSPTTVPASGMGGGGVRFNGGPGGNFAVPGTFDGQQPAGSGLKGGGMRGGGAGAPGAIGPGANMGSTAPWNGGPTSQWQTRGGG